MLCRNVTKFHRQELTYLFQVQQKLKASRSSKLKYSSSCFDTQVVWLYVVVFSQKMPL